MLHPREYLEPVQKSADPFLLSVMANEGLDCWSLSPCLRVRPWLRVVSPVRMDMKAELSFETIELRNRCHNISPL